MNEVYILKMVLKLGISLMKICKNLPMILILGFLNSKMYSMHQYTLHTSEDNTRPLWSIFIIYTFRFLAKMFVK